MKSLKEQNKILNLRENQPDPEKLNQFDLRRKVDELASAGKTARQISEELGEDLRIISDIINGG